MTLDQKQQTALFRYGVIAPLVTGTAQAGISNRAFFRQAAEKCYPSADGSQKKVSASTIEKWYFAYQKGRFAALLPSGRSDAGKSRKLDLDLQERIRYFKKASAYGIPQIWRKSMWLNHPGNWSRSGC